MKTDYIVSPEVRAAALKAAANSTSLKRKVGAAGLTNTGRIVTGWNHLYISGQGSMFDEPCEDKDGNTIDESSTYVRHAEVHMLSNVANDEKLVEVAITHPPCVNCLSLLNASGVSEFEVVQDFLKFDDRKLRYDLMPPWGYEEVVKGLTVGAKKYKPNNWRLVDDTDRYVAAAMRHIEAHRKGELIDEETGCLHTALAAINLIFITDLQLTKGD